MLAPHGLSGHLGLAFLGYVPHVEGSHGNKAATLRYRVKSARGAPQALLLEGGLNARVEGGVGLVIERKAQHEARRGEVAIPRHVDGEKLPCEWCISDAILIVAPILYAPYAAYC